MDSSMSCGRTPAPTALARETPRLEHAPDGGPQRNPMLVGVPLDLIEAGSSRSPRRSIDDAQQIDRVLRRNQHLQYASASRISGPLVETEAAHHVILDAIPAQRLLQFVSTGHSSGMRMAILPGRSSRACVRWNRRMNKELPAPRRPLRTSPRADALLFGPRPLALALQVVGNQGCRPLPEVGCVERCSFCSSRMTASLRVIPSRNRGCLRISAPRQP